MNLSVLRSSFLGKAILASMALAALLAVGAPASKAADWDSCNRRIHYAEMRYREAVEHFGPYSREARHWAHERNEAYEHCHRSYR